MLKRHNVAIAYLFGSRARGKPREESDYDIAIVYHGERRDIVEEVEIALGIADALGVPADRVNVVEVREGEYPLIARILKEGVPIYEESEDLRKSWERRAYLRMLSESDLHAIYAKKARLD